MKTYFLLRDGVHLSEIEGCRIPGNEDIDLGFLRKQVKHLMECYDGNTKFEVFEAKRLKVFRRETRVTEDEE